MKKIQLDSSGFVLVLCAVVLSAVTVGSQVVDGVPFMINYQGRLTDTDGNPVADGEYLITFTIWKDSLSIAPADRKWISPDCPVLVINGLFNWQLGSRESLPPWTVTNDAALWLGIKVGDDPELLPRTRLSSAPYAFKAWQSDYAEYADSAGVVVSPVYPKVLTGAMNGTTDGVTGKITVWFDPGHTDEFSSAPVVFVEVCDPYTGNSKHGIVTSTTLASFEVQVTEAIGGALLLDESIDVKFISIGEN